MAERRGTKALELWCRRMVEGYPGVKIDNMTTSWRDGLAFCAIIHHFRPELIDFSKLSKGDIYHNNDLAFTVAEKHLGITALLEPEDMVEYEVPDRLSILTYVAQFYRAFSTPQGSSPSRIVPKRPATASERGIVSPASTSPPTKMINRSGGIQRRDPCSKCGLPVFIAERLNVGKELYHRTCFRCARCNSQLSLANYYVTDSNQFCCETCPDEETKESSSDVPEFLRGKSLSDEEKSASLEKKYVSDSYSSMFESALENTDDPLLRKDSTLTNQFATARSHFLTMQVEVSQSSASDNETDMEVPELPKTKPPDLKISEDEDNKKNNNSVVINSSVNEKSRINDTDSDLKSVTYRTKNSDQLQAANSSDSYRVNNSIVTKDNSNSSDQVSDRPTSVRDRMKLFESRPSEDKKLKSERNIPQKTDHSISKGKLQLKEINRSPDIISTSTPTPKSSNTTATAKRLTLSPIVSDPPDNSKAKEEPINRNVTSGGVDKTTGEVSKLNSLLEMHILKKSRTSPSLTDLSDKAVGAESTRLTHQSFEDLSIAHQRKLIEEKKDVSALDVKLVDLGVIDSAPKVLQVETHSTTVDHPVSEQLVEKDDSQVLGDGDLKLKPTEEIGATPTRSDDAVEIISSSNSVIEIDEDTSTDNSKKHVSQSGDEIAIIDGSTSIIEISDETKSVIEISDDKTEDYPVDLNPFGDDQENDPPSAVKKSLNPFDEDDDEALQPLPQENEEPVPQKPIPTIRKNLLSKEEKKEKSLNPFDEDTDEDQEEREVPKVPEKKRIPALPLQTENDTPEMLYIKRISLGGNESYQKKNAEKKVLAAPRISLNPVWSDVDDDDGDEGYGKTRGPVPTPRKMRPSPDQHTPEPKLKDQQISSAFGSNSSLSSANSGGQSIRKKKPAPRPPILSPDRQESAQSSLTSSPSTSAQHSPRLSASKNRKTKRAPPPPTFTPKNLSASLDGKTTQTAELSFIEHQNQIRKEWDNEKDIKDEENRNRQSLVFTNPAEDFDIARSSQSGTYVPNKSTYGKWKKKKGPAPSRPIPQKRTIKQLPIPEIKKELDLIELQQQGLEKQGVRLEQIIRERCEGPQVDPNEVEPIDVEDLILQLFEVVNEKNELCRRQAELMYLKKQQRLEEEHVEIEYQIRCLMMQPEANKTDSDKAKEEELIARLVEIVERRNEIIECLEIDRLRENDEDSSITNSLNVYAAKREEVSVPISDEEPDKKDKKKKKRLKLKLSKKTDLDKDVDESESSSLSSNKEKKKKKFALF